MPKDLRLLIVEMVRENPTSGEARIAAELTLKLGIRVSPRTVRAYWPRELRPNRTRSQRWMIFVRNHAKAIVACDFAVAVTLHFQILYVFLVMEVGSMKGSTLSKRHPSQSELACRFQLLDYAKRHRREARHQLRPAEVAQ